MSTLPNYDKFQSLQANLKTLDPALAQSAFIAADAFDMAVRLAKKGDQAQYNKFLNAGVAEFNRLSGSLSKGGAVAAMHGWLAASLAFARQQLPTTTETTDPASTPPPAEPFWKKNLLLIVVSAAALVAVLAYFKVIPIKMN